MKVRWTRPAINQLAEIFRYIRLDRPEAAKRVKQVISERVARLNDMELRFRVGPIPGTHEYVINPLPYIVVYEVNPKEVRILYVRHGAQDWPPTARDRLQ